MAKATLGTALLMCVGAPLAEEPYPACRASIEAQVARQFAQRVTQIEWRMAFTRQYPLRGHSAALVHVAECPGYHYFEMSATSWKCAQPPGSEVVVRYRSSGGGC